MREVISLKGQVKGRGQGGRRVVLEKIADINELMEGEPIEGSRHRFSWIYRCRRGTGTVQWWHILRDGHIQRLGRNYI